MTTEKNTPTAQQSGASAGARRKGPVLVEMSVQGAEGADAQQWLHRSGTAPMVHKVRANTKVVVRVGDERTEDDGQEEAKRLVLKRKNADLQIETQDGEVLLYLESYYQTPGVQLEGSAWIYTSDEALQAISGRNVVMAQELPSTVWGVGWSAHTLGLALGVAAAGGIAAAGGGGGGGGTAGVTTTVRGLVAAGPVVKGHGLSIELYDGAGKKLTQTAVRINDDGTFETVLNGKHATVVAVIRDASGSPDYMDEAARQTIDLKATLAAVGQAVPVRDMNLVKLVVTPLSTLAAEQAGVQLQADGAVQLQGPLTAAQVAKANALVADLFGVADLMEIEPALVIAADGGKNPAYDDSDAVSGAERYGQVLAMLSGLDAGNGGDVSATLAQLRAALSGAASRAEAQAAVKEQLTRGAVEFEFKNAAGTKDYADLMSAAGIGNADTQLGAGETSAVNALVASVVASGTPVSAAAFRQQVDVAAAIQRLAALKPNADGSVTIPDDLRALLTVEGINRLGVSPAVTAATLDAVLSAILRADDSGVATDSVQELGALIGRTQEAFVQITRYAAEPQASDVPPTASQYLEAGVVGVTAANLAAINAALADADCNPGTLGGIQAVVDAYSRILAEANGAQDDATPGVSPTAADYAAIGVNLGAAATDADHLALLNDALGGKVAGDVDSPSEIEGLVAVVNAVQALAALVPNADGSVTIPAPLLAQLTPEHLARLGLSGVTAQNLSSVLEKIAAQPDAGQGTDSLAELQALVDGVNGAAQVVLGYAAEPQTQVVPPDAATYAGVGIEGVTSGNVSAINAALKDAQANPATLADVQTVVDAYNRILAEANGAEADATPGINPGVADYLAIGVDLNAGTSAAHAATNAASDRETLALLNDVVGAKGVADIDTPAKLEAAVEVVNALQALVALAPDPVTGVVTIPDALKAMLTVDALNALGLDPQVTEATRDAVLAALVRADDSGASTDSLAELNALVAAANSALAATVGYAASPQTNTIPPTVAQYEYAGIIGVTQDNLAAINSALADADANPSTPEQIQAVVDAYNRILQVADGNTAAGLAPATLTAADYLALGVNLDAVSAGATSAAGDAETLALLNDLVGHQSTAGVDSVAELQKLADIANALQALAALDPGAPIPGWISGLLTPANLGLIGLENVTPGNLAGVLAGIQAAPNEGGATNSVAGLQSVVDGVLAAVDLINAFADANGSSTPLPGDADYGRYAFTEGSAVLDQTHFAAAGVTGVTAANLNSIKDALATSRVTAASTNTTAKLQGLVDSFNEIRAAADGDAGTAATVTQAQYAAIGINGSLVASLSDPENLSLLNSIVSRKAVGDVDTVSEIGNLVRIVKAVQDTASGLVVNPPLTAADLAVVGVTGVTPENLSQVLAQIATAADDGSQTATLADLQSVINQINYAPANRVPASITVMEDSGPHFVNGLKVSDGDAGDGLITVVLTAPNGTLDVAAATGVTLANNGSASVTLSGTLAAINAALGDNNIQWTPAAGYHGTASFSVQTTDTAPAGTSNGAQSDADTFQISVTAVADAPTGADKTVTINEDGYYTFAAADFGFADHEGVMPANAFDRVRITTLPDVTKGMLSLGASAVTAGQEIAVSDLGNLVYTPGADASGTGYDRFTFQVMDNGGTANGGSNIDGTARTFTLNVNPVAEVVDVVIDAANTTGVQNAFLNAGDTVTVMVTFDQAVNVTGTGTARPSIDLDLGGTLVKAYYDSARSTLANGKVAFSYVILANQFDLDGIAIPANGIKLNGGTITSNSTGNVVAVLDHLQQVANAGYKVDAVNPLLSDISATLVRDAANDTGASTTDGLTRNTTPTFTGTVEAGNGVRVTMGGKTYDSADSGSGLTVNAAGQWTLVIPAIAALTDGSAPNGVTANTGTVYQLDVSSIDVAGNITTRTNAFSFTLDTQAPVAGSVKGQLGQISDTGVQNDNVTSQVKPTLSGTAEAGAVVKIDITVPASVHASGTLSYLTTADSAGHWTIQVGTALVNGSYGFTVTSTDAAGNTITQSGTAFTVDTNDPAANANLRHDATNDTFGPAGFTNGTSSDNITSNPTPVIEGRIGSVGPAYTVGDQVRIVLGSQTYSSEADEDSSGVARVSIMADGTWSFTAAPLAEGNYIPLVAIKGYNQNNYGAPLGGAGFQVDTSASTFGVKGALTVDVDANANTADDNDSGAKGDHHTRDTTPTLNGTAEAGATVSVTLKDTTSGRASPLADVVLPKVLVGADGAWTVTVPNALGDGQWTPAMVITDIAGNSSSPVIGTAFTIDASAPVGQTGGLAAASDTGNGVAGTASDNRTNQTTPVISGTAEAGASVEVTVGGKTYATTAHATTGAWSVTVADALTDTTGGTSYTPSIKVTDKAGNTSTVNGTAFVLDLVGPGAAGITGALKADATNDSGALGDHTTSIRLPVLTGTTEAGTDKVEVMIGGKTYVATVSGTSWSVQVGGLDNGGAGLSGGTYTPQIKVTDAAGNVTTKDGTTFTVDYTAPAATFVTGALTVDADTSAATANDSGTKGDHLTRNNVPVLGGTGEANAGMVVTLKDTTSGRATPLADVVISGLTVGADGNWTASVPVGTPLGDGQWTAQVAMTDKAGNTTVKAVTPFTVDRTAPVGQAGGLAAASDTGNGVAGTASDNRTNQTTPVISGTAEAGASVEVTVGGKTYATTAHATTGAWSVTVADALTDTTGGTSYTPSIKVTDKAGNTSTVNGTAFVLDLVGPGAAGITGALKADATNDSGALGDHTTSIRLPVLTGTTEAGTDKVEVMIGGKTYVATVSGTSWSVQVGGLDNGGAGLSGGTYTPQIKVTDAAGNVTTKDGTTFTVDYTAPAATFVTGALTVDADTSAATANDSGTKGDHLTRNNVPVLGGTGEANAGMVVTLKDTTSGRATPLADVVISGLTVGADGNWTASVPVGTPLGDGQWTAQVAMTDKAGNTTVKAVTPFTVDRTAPVGQAGGLAAASDTGNGVAGTASDNRTNQTTPVISGTAEAGASVEVTVGGKTYATTANTTTGAWSVLVSDPLTDASADRKGTSYTPSIKVTDKAGNTSTVNGTTFFVDTQAVADAGITGGLSGGGTTSLSSTPTLTGSIEAGAGAIVVVVLGGKTYSSNVAGSGLVLNTGTGVWTLTVPAANSLAAGTYAPQITVTDAAGNISNTVTGTSFTVNITLNGELKHDAANDTAGASTGTNADNLTKNTTPTLTGQAPANSEIEITLNGKTYKSVLSQISVDYTTGVWSFTVPVADALTVAQTYAWTLKSIDRNNVSNILSVSGTPFTIDNVVPSVAAADLTGGLSSGVDSGAKGDGITNGVVGGVAQANVVLTGTVEPNAEVAVVLWDNTTNTQVWVSSANAIATSQGVWTVTGPAFASLISNHVYAIKLTPSDKAGNVAAQTTAGTFTYDASKPVFGSIAVSGLDQDGVTAQTNLLTAGDVLVVTAQTAGGEAILLGGTGKPTYELTLGSGTVTATYDVEASNLVTGKMVFKYTVRTGDLDNAGGVTATSAKLVIPGTATLRDVAGNDFDLTAAGVPALAANTVTVDAAAPVLQSLAITPKAGNAAFVVGDTVRITGSFDSPVSTGGDATNLPYVSFKLGSAILTATYNAAATTALGDATKLVFTYPITSSSVGDDLNGLSLLANALTTGDGVAWIRDAAGNDARLISAAVLDNASLTVDTTAPTVTVSRLGNHTITQTNALAANNSDTIKFVFSENPGTSFALADITVKNGTGTALVAGTDFTWGTLSGPALNATSGKYEATVTFTPKTGWAYTGNITFDVLGGTFADLAGNGSSAGNTLTVVVDNQLPAAPALSLSTDTFSAVNTGGNNADKITSNTALSTSAAESGGTTQYKLEKLVSGSYIDQNIGTGGWGILADYVAYMDTASDAQYRVTTRQIDSNGNVGAGLATPLVFTRDTAVTGAVVTVLTSDSGTGSLSTAYTTDKLTNNAQFEVTGFESGAVVQYKVGSGAWTTATLSGGKYLVTDVNIAGAGNTTDNGKAYSVSLRQIDLAGNVRDETTIDLTRDVVAPNVTSGSPNALSARVNVDTPSDVTPMDNLAVTHNDSGVKGDNITADNTPTLSGTGESGAWVTVTLKHTANAAGGGTGLAADVVLSAVQVQSDGTWTVTVPSALAEGTWAPNVSVQDAAGNSASATPASNAGLQAFVIDTSAPVLTVSATRVGGANSGATFILGTDKLLKGEGLVVTFAFDDGIISDSFTQGDLTVTGGVLSNFTRMTSGLPAGAKAAWTAVYTPTDGVDTGTGGITVAAASLQNVAAVVFGSAVARTIQYDTSAPDIVSIKRGVAQPGATGVSAAYNGDTYLNKLETDTADDKATFLVKFSQSVLGVTGSNFALKDLAGNTLSGLSYAVTGSGTDWTIAVSGLQALGNVSGARLDLVNRTGIVDAAGNALASATYGNGEAYTVDQVAPGLVSLTSATTVGTGTPLLTGRAEAGATVQVQVDTAVYTVTVNDSGVWTLDTAAATRASGTAFTLNDGGSVAVTITAIDAAGNSGSATGAAITRANGTPVITTSGVTNDATPTVEGTTTANAWVRVTIGGASYDVQANGSGLWTLDTGTRLPNSGSFNEVLNGNYAITAQTVSGNNGSTSGGLATATLLIDTIAPSAPVITSSPYTNDSTPTLTGTASAGAKVRVSFNGSSYDILADATGGWTLNIDNTKSSGTPTTTQGVRVSGGGYTSDVTTGSKLSNTVATGTTYAVTAREIDAAGNQSPAATQSLIYDNLAPANPTIDAGVMLTSGNTAPMVSGTGEAGAMITLVISGATYQTIVGANGRWSVATASETPVSGAYVAPNAGGSVIAYARQIDAAGNVNSGSTSGTPSSWAVTQTYNYDNTYPAITSSDFTNDTTPVISGTGPVGSSVDVVISGATYRASVGPDGKWSVNTEDVSPVLGSFTMLANGQSYSVTATVTGTSKTTGQSLTVDTVAPATLTINTVAGDDFINLLEKGNVTLTGTVEVGSSVTLGIAGNQRAATVKADGTWSYLLTSADYAALGESASTGDLLIQATARDKAGNQMVRGRNITVDTIAPVIDLDRGSSSNNYSLALTAKNVALSLDNGNTLDVTDASVTEVGGVAAVKIGFQQVQANGTVIGFGPQDGANEQLLIGDQVLNINGTNLPSQLSYGGLVWYIDYAAGIFTLSAASAASAAAAQAMLRNIRYLNKDTSTIADDNNRVFSFQLVDKAGNLSATVTSTVSSDALPPTLNLDGNDSSGATGGRYTATVTGSAAMRLADTDLALNEVGNGNSRIASINLAVAGLQDGANEKLLVNTATGALAGGWAASGAGWVNGSTLTLGGKTWAVRYGSGAFTFELADGSTASDAEAQGLIDALRYQNTSATATDGARGFQFTITDGVGNTMAAPVESVISYVAVAPAAASVSPLVTADANGDGVRGDQFTFNFSELVRVSDIVNTANWSVLGAATLVNGTFATSDNWAAAATNNLPPSYNSGSQRWEFNTGNGTNATAGGTLTSDNFTTVVGATYTVSFKVGSTVASSLGALQLAVQRSDTNANLATVDASSSSVAGGTYTLTFVATTTSTRLVFTNTLGAASADVWLDDVVLTSPTLNNATITAQNVQTINGEDYARSFVVSGATNLSGNHQAGATDSSNPVESQFTIGAVNVIDTTGIQASGPVIFSMTDITPVASTTVGLPSSISGDNRISKVEAAAGRSVAYTYTPTSGDKMLLYVNGVLAATQTAVAGNNTFPLIDSTVNNLGADGQKSITVRVEDAAGNLSAPTLPKIITLDTQLSQGIAGSTFTDADANGVDPGDTVQLVFNEAVNLSTATLDAKFGAGATATAVGGAANLSTTWNITLGTAPAGGFALDGATVTIAGANDAAGNTGGVSGVADIGATLPADLTNQPGTPTIGNVSTDNIIGSAAEATTVRINVANLNGTDAVKLYMDGVELTGLAEASRVTGASGYVELSLPAGAWGGDGERSLSASVQRTGGTAVKSVFERHVYVNSDGNHWSVVGGANSALWFDPDSLLGSVAQGNSVTTWSANTGGSLATAATGDTNVSGGPTVVNSNGHVGLKFTVSGSTLQALNFTDPNGIVWDPSDVNGAYMTVIMSANSYYGAPLAVSSAASTGNSSGFKLGTSIANNTQLQYTNYARADFNSPANTVSANQTGILSSRTLFNGAKWTLEGYYNNALVINSEGAASKVNLQSAPNILRIGSEATGGVSVASISFTGTIHDIVWLNYTATNNQVTEINAYMAAKYQFSNNINSSGGVYLGNTSANGNALIDGFLALTQSGSDDTILVAGSDYINAGAGKDTVLADDLKFRTLNAGQGFDTFALSASYSNAASGSSFRLSDYVSNARGMNDSFGGTADDARVNANGYHKLQGFEKLSFFQATEKQTVQLTFADIDQLAEKNLAQGTNVTVNATTSNLFVELGGNDWLDVVSSGLGNVTYGFWQDANGTAYDRRYTGTVSSDTATLYVRGGDDAPNFGATSTTAVVGASSVTVDFNELIGNFSGPGSNWTLASAGSTISGWSTGTTAGKSTLTLSGSYNQNAYLDVTYTGSAIVDSNGDQLRYKGLAIGIATADIIDLSGKGAATNAALGAGYAIYGNDGKDMLIGTGWDDLLVGGAGNDTLTGGLGADTFRTIQYEGGSDTVTDFSKIGGDKIDLRGILQGTSVEGNIVWNADGTISAQSFAELTKYVDLSANGTAMLLKVDDSGLASFASPAYQMQLLSTNVAGNLSGTDLQMLINSHVILI